MSHKNRTPTRESSVKREVRSPKYRQRVEQDKTKYDRKSKHKHVSKRESD